MPEKRRRREITSESDPLSPPPHPVYIEDKTVQTCLCPFETSLGLPWDGRNPALLCGGLSPASAAAVVMVVLIHAVATIVVLLCDTMGGWHMKVSVVLC